MNALDVKKLVDFDRIMDIINLCFANKDAVHLAFEFNGKKYTVEKNMYNEVRITRDNECELYIACNFGIRNKKNHNILINYDGIALVFYDYKEHAPSVHLRSEGFLAKDKDVAKSFNVTLRGSFGHIFYPLNELDGSNIPVVDDTNGGALIFGEDGVRYRDYLFSNDGKLFYRGQEVPSEVDLEIREGIRCNDPTINYYVRDQLDFYRTEFKDFMKIIKLRDRILNSGMETYLFSKNEIHMVYLNLYKALVESKEKNGAKTIG